MMIMNYLSNLHYLANNHIPGAAAALLQYDRTNAEQVNVAIYWRH